MGTYVNANKRKRYSVVLQGNYGYGWDDLITYENEDDKEIDDDFRAYIENEKNAIFRLTYRKRRSKGE